MRYELYYWPTIQGRGEFVRLVLEAAGADYIDVGNLDGEQQGVKRLMQYLEDKAIERPPFAPPYLRAGRLLIGQTANILQYLGPRLGLVPKDLASRLWTQQLQLTIADAVAEAHDTHHPVGASLYYEDQKPEAKRRALDFVSRRIPKFLGYFEAVLTRDPQGPAHLVGHRLSYADLSLFQLIAGLRYAFPKSMRRRASKWPRVLALAAAVEQHPRIAAYLVSDRRLAFSEDGIFRHYPELDRIG
jgi:glutathione S-transferase